MMTLASPVGSSDVAFVLGGAKTVWADLKEAKELAIPHTYIATNETGRDFIDFLPHWCTLHTEKITAWYMQRINWRCKGDGDIGQFWTSNVKTLPNNDFLTPLSFRHVQSWDGSSGLLAITVALALGYQKIILCGVPLDKKAGHYFSPDEPWMDGPRYRHAWIKHKGDMEGRVKSMGGWTQSLLGAPTKEWVQNAQN